MTCQLGATVFFFLLFPRRRQRKSWSRWFSRRLITLIFAGRDRIIVIRRELPRTNDADSARRPTALIRIKLQFVGCESISYSAKQRLLIRDSHPVAVKLGKRDAELLMVALGFFL